MPNENVDRVRGGKKNKPKKLPDKDNGLTVFCILLLMQNTHVVRDGGEFMEGSRGGEINLENSGCHDNIMSSKSGISEPVFAWEDRGAQKGKN